MVSKTRLNTHHQDLIAMATEHTDGSNEAETQPAEEIEKQ